MCVSRLSGLRYCDDHTVLRVGRPAWPPFLILLSEKKAKKASQACQSKGLLHSTQAWEQLDSSTRESIRSYSDYVLHVGLLCVPTVCCFLMEEGRNVGVWAAGKAKGKGMIYARQNSRGKHLMVWLGMSDFAVDRRKKKRKKKGEKLIDGSSQQPQRHFILPS